MLFSCLIMAFSLAAISFTNGSDSKRILLSDPQYIQQELTRFQSELQEMQVKYNQLSTLETKYNTQNTKLADLQTKYDTQNTKLVELQVKDDAQNTNLTDLQSKCNIQHTKLADLQTKYNTQHTELADLQVKYDSQLQSYNATVMTLQTTISTLHNSLTSQDVIIKTIQGDKGAVFTRWGRRDCPANITTMVYSGTAGGSYHTHTGAAAEYVCMPNDPIWGPHKDLVYGENVGYIYGAEYSEPIDLFSMPNYAEDVPCAVCLGTQNTASLMIPGRTQCYPGWTEVYHGDLASGNHGFQAASQYEKRILLSDPQYIEQELTRFQSELQEMQVKNNAQN